MRKAVPLASLRGTLRPCEGHRSGEGPSDLLGEMMVGVQGGGRLVEQMENYTWRTAPVHSQSRAVGSGFPDPS